MAERPNEGDVLAFLCNLFRIKEIFGIFTQDLPMKMSEISPRVSEEFDHDLLWPVMVKHAQSHKECKRLISGKNTSLLRPPRHQLH